MMAMDRKYTLLAGFNVREKWNEDYIPHYYCNRCKAQLDESMLLDGFPKRGHEPTECVEGLAQRLADIEDRLNSHNL